MKRFWLLALLLGAVACSAFGQVVDTTVCAVLKDPASFNGKTVRIKGTVVASFDQFVVDDGDCGEPVNGIWLAYPQGAKAKSGPVAMIELQPAHNFAGTAPQAARPAVTFTRDKVFKQFDSLLAQRHDVNVGVCLGCTRNEVQATLVGRLDGVSDAQVQQDANGKIIGLGGFGNLNAYPARLVLESVSDVSPKPIDYSASDAILKKAPSGGNESINQGEMDPVPTARKVAGYMAGSPAATQIQSDLTLLPDGKTPGIVNLAYGAVDEVSANDGAPSDKDSPDGVLYNCTFNRDRLPGLALAMAVIHMAQHAADIRTKREPGERAPLYILENNAWAVTATMAIAGGEKYLILPGGYMMWDAAWPDSDRLNNMMSALSDFLSKEEMLNK